MRGWFETVLKDQGGGLRLLLIGALTLILLIPLSMVEGVINERSWRHQEVLNDIARQHGGEQRLIGPFLVVPYVTEIRVPIVEGDSTKQKEVIRHRIVKKESFAVILPEDIGINAKLSHSTRKRGVYSTPVYSAEIAISGAFRTPDLVAIIPNLARVHWGQAAIVLGVSDLTGLTAVEDITSDIGKQAFEAGMPGYAAALFERVRITRINAAAMRDGRAYAPKGAARFGAVHAPLDVSARGSAGDSFTFKTTMRLNGSGGFFAVPAAKQSEIAITGDWPHPSFQGAPLPGKRTVTADGFTASWSVPALARGYGAVSYGGAETRLLADAAESAIGFRHARPDDFYNAAQRAVKYGVLFVALTFLACFVMERFGGKRLHPAQYGLVGLSLALFYLLLISLAERIGLAGAYGAAAAVIAGMNGAYVGVAIGSLKRGLGAGGALATLYAAFYVMLMSEDDALLIGSGLLLLGVAMAMAATARIS